MMLYRDYQDKRISAVGLVLTDATPRALVRRAIELGVNCFDVMELSGPLPSPIAALPRDSYVLMSGFPGLDLGNFGKVLEVFENQLARIGAERFDFYRLDNVCLHNIDAYINPAYGVVPFLAGQRDEGRIGALGFSSTSNRHTFTRMLVLYSGLLDFAQMQINWFDWSFQDVRGKCDMLAKYDMPLVATGLMRDGLLEEIPAVNRHALEEMRPSETPLGWAVGFQQSVPRLMASLVAPSSTEELERICARFDDQQPLSPAEITELRRATWRMTRGIELSCTSCNTCMPACPAMLDIPMLLRLRNDCVMSPKSPVPALEVKALGAHNDPARCIGCGECEAVCPQQLAIATALPEFAEMLAEG